MIKNFVMRLLLLFFGILGFSANVAAQSDFMNNSNAIPAMPNPSPRPSAPPTNAPSGLYTPNVFSPNKSPVAPKSVIPEKEVDMKTQTFANSGDIYKDQLNKNLKQSEGSGIDMKQFRKNVSFGEIKTKSAYIRVRYRDVGQVDGDMVKLLINDRVIYNELFLEYDYKEIRINLLQGFNKVDFEALNEGFYSPNTAGFTILDDQDKVLISNYWNLATGFKAVYMVIKE